MSDEKQARKSFAGSYRFIFLLILGIAAGCVVGMIMGERAVALRPLGQLFLYFMFTAVVPLVFFNMVSSVASMRNMHRLEKILVNTLGIFVVTGIVASIFIIIILSIFPPAEGVSIEIGAYEAAEKISLLDQVVRSFSVSDFYLLLSKSAMLPLIIFSVVLGWCITSVTQHKENSVVIEFMNTMSDAFMKMISIIMLYAPIGLGAYFAALVGEYGSELMGAYARAVLMFYPICIAYFLTAFPAYAWYAGGAKGVKVFYKYIFPAVVTSFATQSSIATLPTNFDCAEKMGCEKDVSSIVLPMGATIHMDGTVLTTIMKIAFLFGIFRMPFIGISTWTIAILISILTGVVLSGIPSGGMLGSLIIVGFYGFNPDVIPIIVSIGLLTDPIATTINSTGDAVTTMMVTKRVDGSDWLEKKIASGKVSI